MDTSANNGPSSERKKPTVAIIVPLSMRPDLTSEEEISLRHLDHYLNRYDRYFVQPRGMGFRRPGFEVMEFDEHFFGSLEAHKRLLFSKNLYERFASYDFLMTYHLDALVLSDQLEEWCKAGYDLIGAPWIPSSDTPWVRRPEVGNTGFCLRRIDATLRVLTSKRRWIEPDQYWRKLRDRSQLSRFIHWPVGYLKWLRLYNGIEDHLAAWDDNDDRFWAQHAVHYDPKFQIAPFERALEFAFEAEPRKCLELNGGRLPFGCHAWARYDRAFWEPFLLE